MKAFRQDSLGLTLTLSTLLHVLGVAVMVWLGNAVVQPGQDAPLAVEVWDVPPPSPSALTETMAQPKHTPAVDMTAPSEPPPDTDVKIHQAEAPKRRWLASAPQPALSPTPLAKQKKVIQEKNAKTAAPSNGPQRTVLAETQPHKNKVPQSKKNVPLPARQEADDLLAALGNASARSSSSSKNAYTGKAQGTSYSSGDSGKEGYIAKVRAKIRPLIQLPDGIKDNPEAVVLVTLLPSLEVREVKLLNSSGNPAYDEAVQKAVWDARMFPSLPAGSNFVEYRQLRLTFRPYQ